MIYQLYSEFNNERMKLRFVTNIIQILLKYITIFIK